MSKIDLASIASDPRNAVLFQRLTTPQDRFRYVCRVATDMDVRRLKALVYANFLRTLYWSVVRDYVIARDLGKCKSCGSDRNLEVHHTSYAYQGEEFRSMDCLVLLCSGCHATGHLMQKASTDTHRTEAVVSGLARKLVHKAVRGAVVNRNYDPRVIMDLKQYGSVLGFAGRGRGSTSEE